MKEKKESILQSISFKYHLFPAVSVIQAPNWPRSILENKMVEPVGLMLCFGPLQDNLPNCPGEGGTKIKEGIVEGRGITRRKMLISFPLNDLLLSVPITSAIFISAIFFSA